MQLILSCIILPPFHIFLIFRNTNVSTTFSFIIILDGHFLFLPCVFYHVLCLSFLLGSKTCRSLYGRISSFPLMSKSRSKIWSSTQDYLALFRESQLGFLNLILSTRPAPFPLHYRPWPAIAIVYISDNDLTLQLIKTVASIVVKGSWLQLNNPT